MGLLGDWAKSKRMSQPVRGTAQVVSASMPLLVAVSRKDFLGALTGRSPAGRLAGTLAALGAASGGGADILRVHDVAEARDYLAVRAALNGDARVEHDLRLDHQLRREAV